ncbi:MAG TPA: DUF1737 domain-containing protein [Longimicrobium sp.]
MSIEYRVITYHGDWRFKEPSEQFDRRITEMIAAGWRPLGGVSHAVTWESDGNESITFAQALIRDTGDGT